MCQQTQGIVLEKKLVDLEVSSDDIQMELLETVRREIQAIGGSKTEARKITAEKVPPSDPLTLRPSTS